MLSKEQVREILVRRAGAQLELERANKDAGYIFCDNPYHKEMHVHGPRLLEIAETLQATITFNPLWDNNRTMEVYFYIELFGEQWRIFGLVHRTEELNEE